MLTVYSTVSEGDTIMAHVSRTISMIDEGTPPNDSLATVYVEGSDGTSDTLMHLMRGHYYSELFAQEGVTYDFTVTRENLPTVTGQVYTLMAMDSVKLVYVDTGRQMMPGGWGWPYTDVELTIYDSDETVYYEVAGYSLYIDPSGATWSGGARIATDDVLLGGAPYGGNQWGSGNIQFSNESFRGQARVIPFRIYDQEYPNQRLGLKVTKMDESKYLYNFQIDQSRNVGPFSQPVTSYVNVVGGLGCLSSESEVIELL